MRGYYRHVIRLNMAHATGEWTAAMIQRIRAVAVGASHHYPHRRRSATPVFDYCRPLITLPTVSNLGDLKSVQS
jgi:hypothetical protein